MHIHVVKRGDTLSSIAAMHDALPAFVAADNGLALSTPLVIGQALVVRTPKTLHTVRAGETLSSIARDYDLSVRTLLRRNFFLHGRELLREGDVLAIDYADEAPLGTLGVNAYAYPYIGGELLDSDVSDAVHLRHHARGSPCAARRRAPARTCGALWRKIAHAPLDADAGGEFFERKRRAAPAKRPRAERAPCRDFADDGEKGLLL